MSSYYNENDPFAAAWLRRLIQAGLIAEGFIDERDIRDVQPADLAGYDRCHFFAGIGGWDLALQLACWDGPVWTGSCPCQPFSSAGKGDGFADPRHLWPAWFRLIRECRPPVVFGEQVASKDGLAWFDHVSTDLEAEDYAVGAADLCAAGVGAPHIRQRLWFVADTEHAQRRKIGFDGHDGRNRQDLRRKETYCESGARSQVLTERMVHANGEGRPRGVGEPKAPRNGRTRIVEAGDVGGLGDTASGGLSWSDRPSEQEQGSGEGRDARGMVHASSDRRKLSWFKEHAAQQGAPGPEPDGPGARRPWDWAIQLLCRDGKARPAQPGIFPLAPRVSGGVAVGSAVQAPAATFSPEEAAHVLSASGVLRGSGNSIVPQVAAEFVMAFMMSREGQG